MTLSKEALLGASDIHERDVDLPLLGDTVRVRSLSAAYSNEAIQEAAEFVTIKGEQTMQINVNKAEALKVLNGLVSPKLDTLQEAMDLQKHLGPSWKLIVEAIDDTSGIDKEAIKNANRLFQPGGPGEEPGPAASNGVAVRDQGPDLPVRTGAGAADAGGGAG